MERVLPSNVDYTKILPLAVESRSRRRSFFPTNGQTFTSDGNNIIRIDIFIVYNYEFVDNYCIFCQSYLFIIAKLTTTGSAAAASAAY